MSKMSDYGATKRVPTADVRTGHTIWASGFKCPVRVLAVQHRESTNTRLFHYEMEIWGRVRRYTIERSATGTTTVLTRTEA